MKKIVLSNGETEQIVNGYMSGLSKKVLEIQFGISNTVVTRILKENGVNIRDNSHKKRTYSFDESYFDNIDTENKAYILGLLYSDGCNNTAANTVFIELQDRDRQILEDIRKEMSSNHPIHYNNLNSKNKNWHDTYRFSITNQHISKRLSELGVVRNKSLILNFPDWLNEELIPSFLRGYFDGDGHIEWNKTKFLTLVGTDKFCKSTQNYLNGKNIKSSIYNSASDNNITKLLSISGKDNIFNFLNLIYDNSVLHIERKYNLYLSIKREMISLTA